METIDNGPVASSLDSSHRAISISMVIALSFSREATHQLRSVISMNMQLSFITIDSEGRSTVTELELKGNKGHGNPSATVVLILFSYFSHRLVLSDLGKIKIYSGV